MSEGVGLCREGRARAQHREGGELELSTGHSTGGAEARALYGEWSGPEPLPLHGLDR